MVEQGIDAQDAVRASAPITGFVDYSPKEQYLFNQWIHKTRSIYDAFGFVPLHLRPVERLVALNGEGETQKQIFELFRADTAQTTGLGLPFDRTVPLALWIAEHAGHLQHLPLPFKRYDIGISCRGERPKTGRFRAFVQADIDIVGRQLSLASDVECMSAALRVLESLEVGQVKVRFNHLGVVKSILKEREVPSSCQSAFLRAIDKLDKLSQEAVIAEIMQIAGWNLSAQETASLVALFSQQPSLDDPALGNAYGEGAKEGLHQLQQMRALFQQAGFDASVFQFLPGMVRGLAYYTGIVFETVLVGYEQFGSIAGGGRYSNLVGDFASGLQDVEGVGISVGLTRLFDVIGKTQGHSSQRISPAQVLVGARTEGLMYLAHQWGRHLRALGLKVDIYSGVPKVKQVLSHANALGIPYTALVMDESAFVVKAMASQTQLEFPTLEQASALSLYH